MQNILLFGNGTVPGLAQLTNVSIHGMNPNQDLDGNAENGNQTLATAVNQPIPDAETAIESGADITLTIEEAFEETYHTLLTYNPALFESGSE